MEYSILYYTEEEIEKLFGLHMEKQGELVVVENEAKLVLTNLQTLNSERNLIRSYIVNANLIGLSSVEIFCRYNYNNIKKLKEKKIKRLLLELERSYSRTCCLEICRSMQFIQFENNKERSYQ